jgi:hypothetical protein
MAARGYTTTMAVSDYLGGDLTQAQLAVVEDLIEPAEEWLRRTFGVDYLPGAVVNEAYYAVAGPDLYLRKAPVTGVTSLTYRTTAGGTETTITAATGWELRDATLGWVRLLDPQPSPGAPLNRLLATYTPVATVPAFVQLATTIRVADLLRPIGGGDLPAGVSEVDFGELRIKAIPEPSKRAMGEIGTVMGQRRAVMFA